MVKVDIPHIIRILKKESDKYHVPVVGEITLRKDPYRILISCILSLRTKDEVTAEASKRLFEEAGDVIELSTMKVSRIEKLIYPVGFYKTKARRIKNIAKVLIEAHAGRVPDNIEELLTLKGVGRKTANIVITAGYNKPGVAVDTHVHRISNRLGYVNTKTPEKTEKVLRKKLPQRYWVIYGNLLVMWGQNICRPISPMCSKCPISRYCNKVGVTKTR